MAKVLYRQLEIGCDLAIWPAINGRVNGLLWWVFVYGEASKSVVMGSEWAGRRMARGVGGVAGKLGCNRAQPLPKGSH